MDFFLEIKCEKKHIKGPLSRQSIIRSLEKSKGFSEGIKKCSHFSVLQFLYNKFSRCFLHNFVFQPRLVVSIYYCNVHTVIYESAALFCKYTRTSMVSLYFPSAKTMMSRIDVFHRSRAQFTFKLKNTSFSMLL